LNFKESAMPVRGLLAVIVLSGACTTGKDRYTTVEGDLRRAIPLGMNARDAARELDSLGIVHSPFESDSGRIVAIVRSVRKDLLTQTDARFDLVFNSDGKLARITGRRLYTGP
jgi:hypothetical protein